MIVTEDERTGSTAWIEPCQSIPPWEGKKLLRMKWFRDFKSECVLYQCKAVADEMIF